MDERSDRSIVVYRSRGEQLINEFIWSDAGAQFLFIFGIAVLLFLGGLWYYIERNSSRNKKW